MRGLETLSGAGGGRNLPRHLFEVLLVFWHLPVFVTQVQDMQELGILVSTFETVDIWGAPAVSINCKGQTASPKRMKLRKSRGSFSIKKFILQILDL